MAKSAVSEVLDKVKTPSLEDIDVETKDLMPEKILENYMIVSENASAWEAKKERLKASVDALRKGKTTEYPGIFRRVKGTFVITHVETEMSRASLDVVQHWLSIGVINQEQYNACVKTAPSIYNKVTFKKTV